MNGNGQVKDHEAPKAFDPVAEGRKGAMKREENRRERIAQTRQALEAAAPQAVDTMLELMNEAEPIVREGVRGTVVAFEPRGVRFNAARYVLDQVLGAATQRIEHVSLDGLDAEFDKLVEQMGAKP